MGIFIERKNLIRKIKETLKRHNLLLIKAPLGSGKTTLAKTLVKTLKKALYLQFSEEHLKLDALVHIIEFLKNKKRETQVFIFDDFDILERKSLTRKIFRNFIKEELNDKKIIVFSCHSIEPVLPFSANVIKEEDIFFNKKELKLFFEKKNIKLQKEEAERVYKLTKGWILGIKLVSENWEDFKRKNYEFSELTHFIKSVIEQNISSNLKNMIGFLSFLPSECEIELLKNITGDELYKKIKTLITIMERRGLLLSLEKKKIHMHPILIKTIRRYYYSHRLYPYFIKLVKLYQEEDPVFVIELCLELNERKVLRKILKEKGIELLIHGEYKVIDKIINSEIIGEKDKIIIKSLRELSKGNLKNLKYYIKQLKNNGYDFYADYIFVTLNKLKGDVIKNIKFINRTISKYKGKERLNLLNILATSYLLENNFNKAIEIYRSVKRSARRLKNRRAELSAEFNIEIIRKERAEINPVRMFKLMKEFENMGDEVNKLVSLYHLSEALFLNRDIENAKIYIHKGKKYSEFLDKFLFASFLELEGRIYLFENKFEPAKNKFIESAKILKRMESEFYLSPLLHFYILLCLKKEKVEVVLKCIENILMLEKSLKTFVKRPLEIFGEFIYKYIYLKRKESQFDILKEIEKMVRKGEILNSLLLLYYFVKISEIYGMEPEKLKQKFTELIRKYPLPLVCITEGEKEVQKIFIRTLGRFSILINNKEIPLKHFKGRKTRKIFKYLITKFENVCSDREIKKYFFRETKDFKNALYFCISEIRRFLKNNKIPLEIEREEKGYIMKGNKEIIDKFIFLEKIGELNKNIDSERKLNLIKEIENLYSDDYLICEPVSSWVVEERKRMRILFSMVLFNKANLMSEKDKVKTEEILREALKYNPLNLEAYRLWIKLQDSSDKIEKIIRKMQKEFYLRTRKILRIKSFNKYTV